MSTRKTILGISLFAIFFGFTFAKTKDTICTMEYAPVCASVQVQCIKAPCPAIEQTFGNKCQMNANTLATFLHEGECGKVKEDLSHCESYFDGCNNCSVVDGKISACTEMYCENPGKAKCTKYKSDLDLSNCESYFDGCNTCSVVDGKVAGCTKMYCQKNQEAKCLKYKDIVGMANPASVYCEKNGGTLTISSDERGEYGTCVFSDGSSCEEWAYYRGECKQSSPVEKYLSGYIDKNSHKFPSLESKVSFLQNLKNKFTLTYKSIASSIEKFIESLYFNDYEKKKFTLDSDGKFLSFMLNIPKSRKNKYNEHIVLDKTSSTLIFKYNQAKEANMIFSITAIKQSDRENLASQPLLNTNKIGESDGYVFYYSQSLDMPYTGKYAREYSEMCGSIKNIMDTFKIIQ